MAVASMSAFNVPPPRRRIATYGKTTRRPQYSLQTEATDSQRPPAPSSMTPIRKRLVTAVGDKAPGVGKLVRPDVARSTTTSVDVFDVPVSDDERVPSRPPIARDHSSPGRASSARNNVRSNRITAPGKDRQSEQVAIRRKRKRTTPTSHSLANDAANEVQIADEHVMARIPLAGNVSKAVSPDNAEEPPPSSPLTDIAALEERMQDVEVAVKSPRRTRIRAATRRPSIKKGRSEPVILKNMLSGLESSSEGARDVHTNPPKTSLTPRKRVTTGINVDHTTPPNGGSGSPASNRTGSATPRQTELLNRLLDQSSIVARPSELISLAVDKLHIPEQPPTKSSRLVRSRSDIPQSTQTRRVRLIDTLIRSAPLREDPEDMDDTEKGPDDDNPSDECFNTMELSTSTSQDAATSQITSHSVGGTRVTYASQRSYLNDSNMDTDLLFNISLQAPSPVVARRRDLILPQLSKGQSSLGMDGEELEDSQGALRSVHELRAAGGKKRFTDDMETLLNEIEGHGASSLSRKRSAMVELCTKLVGKGYVAQMVDHGFDHRLFRACADASDTIIAFAMAAAAVLIIHSGPSASVHQQIHGSGCLKTLTPLADIERDIISIAKERRTNMSKVAQASVAELRTLIQDSSVWGAKKPQTVTPRTVVLKSMDLLVRALRKNRNTDALLDEQTVSKLTGIVERPVKGLSEGFPVDTLDMELALSVLESSSIMSGPASERHGWSHQSLTRLATVLGRVFDMPDQGAGQIEVLALRLCLNVTNHNAKVCELFAKPTLIVPLVSSIDRYFAFLRADQTELEGFSILDRLIVSLGAMINLAEFSDTARLSVMTDGDHLLFGLIRSFLEGLERASQVSLAPPTSSPLCPY